MLNEKPSFPNTPLDPATILGMNDDSFEQRWSEANSVVRPSEELKETYQEHDMLHFRSVDPPRYTRVRRLYAALYGTVGIGAGAASQHFTGDIRPFFSVPVSGFAGYQLVQSFRKSAPRFEKRHTEIMERERVLRERVQEVDTEFSPVEQSRGRLIYNVGTLSHYLNSGRGKKSLVHMTSGFVETLQQELDASLDVARANIKDGLEIACITQDTTKSVIDALRELAATDRKELPRRLRVTAMHTDAILSPLTKAYEEISQHVNLLHNVEAGRAKLPPKVETSFSPDFRTVVFQISFGRPDSNRPQNSPGSNQRSSISHNEISRGLGR